MLHSYSSLINAPLNAWCLAYPPPSRLAPLERKPSHLARSIAKINVQVSVATQRKNNGPPSRLPRCNFGRSNPSESLKQLEHSPRTLDLQTLRCTALKRAGSLQFAPV